jgi:hypothetical protein
MAMGVEGNFEYGETVATPVGLISFPQVWEAVENNFKAGKFEFSCQLLIPKEGSDLSTLVAEAMKPTKRLFGDKYKKLRDMDDHCPIKDGDDKGPEHPSYGHWVIKATAGKTKRPFVVDKSNRPIGDHEEIYGGAIGLLWVRALAYDMKVGKGAKFLLEGVQKIADGKPFGPARFDPAAAGFKAPEVPSYLSGHVETNRSASRVPHQVADSLPAHEAALIKAVTSSATAGFSGDVDNDPPF